MDQTLWDARPAVPALSVLALEMLAWVRLLEVLISLDSYLPVVSIGRE